ncbi:hypothetical protein [Streptomyces sp. NPDC047014]|uniref:hypothetical protein n=1 Tax=Streptomyces sp. NPDC047014 TaxID=3155736 RepID=UPI0033D7CF3C
MHTYPLTPLTPLMTSTSATRTRSAPALVVHPLPPRAEGCAARYSDHAAGTPDFGALFATRHCPCEGGARGAVWQLTPRTAHLLHTALVVLADQAYEDAQHLGDRFLPDAGPGALEALDRLPSLTWMADHGWRRRMARAFDDLAEDLTAGLRPVPTCPAEEAALRLAAPRPGSWHSPTRRLSSAAQW